MAYGGEWVIDTADVGQYHGSAPRPRSVRGTNTETRAQSQGAPAPHRKPKQDVAILRHGGARLKSYHLFVNSLFIMFLVHIYPSATHCGMF